MRPWTCLLLLAACGSVDANNDGGPDDGGPASLTVTVEGSGTVSSTPTGISCPGTCTATFTTGVPITLAAAPMTGMSFTGWSGACAPGRGDCQVTLTADATASARFAAQGAKRWFLNAGVAGTFSQVWAAAAGDGVVFITGRLGGAATVGGMAAQAGTFLAKLSSDTGQALWVKNISGGVVATELVMDANGDVAVAGFFDGTVDFGNGSVTSVAASTDALVAKYRGSDGAYVWARPIGGDFFDFGAALAVDAGGDAYVAGSFSRTVDFGGGGRTSVGGDTDDIFVARYTAASGAYVWDRTFGNANYEQLYGVVVDHAGNVAFTGTFTGSMMMGTMFLNSGTNSDALLAKLEGGTGNVLFAKRFGGADSDSGQRIAVDASDNLIVSGSYTSPADVGGQPLPAAGTQWYAKYTTAGAHLWSRGFPVGGFGRVVADSLGDVVVAASFSGNVDFGGTTLASAGQGDIFVAKYGGPGGGLLWAKRYGGAAGDQGNGIAVDPLDRLFAVGYFTGFAEFDGQSLTSTGSNDLFVISVEP